jgi:hypothetical protein
MNPITPHRRNPIVTAKTLCLDVKILFPLARRSLGEGGSFLFSVSLFMQTLLILSNKVDFFNKWYILIYIQ